MSKKNRMKITNVVLIPKVDTSQTVRDLRPISLCNVVYKTISKVLWNRLKLVLPGLVDNAQFAFVFGRSIQDNVIVAFEALHAMKNKRCETHRDLTLYAIVRHMTELSGNISRGCFKGCCFMRNGLDGCDFVFDRLNTPLRWMTILWDPLHRAEGYGKDIHCHRTFSSCAWKGCRSL